MSPSADPDIRVRAEIARPPAEVWRVLSDLEAVERYSAGVRSAVTTSDVATGVGAARTCRLAPFGTLEETVTEWEETRRISFQIEPAGLPIRSSTATFRLDTVDGGTRVTMDYDFEVPGGPLGRVAKPVLSAQLRKGLQEMLDGLRDHVERGAEATIASR